MAEEVFPAALPFETEIPPLKGMKLKPQNIHRQVSLLNINQDVWLILNNIRKVFKFPSIRTHTHKNQLVEEQLMMLNRGGR